VSDTERFGPVVVTGNILGGERKGMTMRRMGGTWGILAGAFLLFSADAEAYSSMRCGNQLVSKGDSAYEVRAVCGQPDHEEHYVQERTVREKTGRKCRTDDDGDRDCWTIYRERTIEIPMTRFTYDFGKNRFIHYLTFERGILRGISNGGYGKKPPAPG
jgi:hypothetical protein